MTNLYDQLADIINQQHDPVLYDKNEPYRGISWLWNGDAFYAKRPDIETSERADWYALPGHPEILLYAGHVAVAGRNLPVHPDDSARPEDVTLAQSYLADPAVAEAYAVVREVLDQTAHH